MKNLRIAYFISSHGFGHASRSTAIMEAVLRKNPSVRFDIYSGTPEWFFRDAGLKTPVFHAGAVDVGLFQKSPMEHDIPVTIRLLHEYLEEIPSRASVFANELKVSGTDLVLCDISPLGIVTAKKARIPCVLFENFTWDWMYRPYEEKYPKFREINDRLQEIFSLPDYRLQSDPLCEVSPRQTLFIPPVSRSVREDAEALRKRLGVPEGNRMGMITMGGIPEKMEFALGHKVPEGITLVLCGTFEKHEKRGSMILLPHHTDFYHPDLVHASDFLIGKAGYSTIGEVCNSGAAYGYIERDDFRESSVTASFLEKRPNTLEINPTRFQNFELSPEIDQLLALGKIAPQPVNGSEIASDFILGLV